MSHKKANHKKHVKEIVNNCTHIHVSIGNLNIGSGEPLGQERPEERLLDRLQRVGDIIEKITKTEGRPSVDPDTILKFAEINLERSKGKVASEKDPVDNIAWQMRVDSFTRLREAVLRFISDEKSVNIYRETQGRKDKSSEETKEEAGTEEKEVE